MFTFLVFNQQRNIKKYGANTIFLKKLTLNQTNLTIIKVEILHFINFFASKSCFKKVI